MAIKRFEGPKNANRHDRSRGFDHRKADAGAGRLELAIAAPRAFGEQDDGAPCQEPIENRS